MKFGSVSYNDPCDYGRKGTPPKFNGWNLKMMVSKRNLLFQGLIFRFHVSLPLPWKFVQNFQVYDGKTGMALDQPVTVGVSQLGSECANFRKEIQGKGFDILYMHLCNLCILSTKSCKSANGKLVVWVGGLGF